MKTKAAARLLRAPRNVPGRRPKGWIGDLIYRVATPAERQAIDADPGLIDKIVAAGFAAGAFVEKMSYDPVQHRKVKHYVASPAAVALHKAGLL